MEIFCLDTVDSTNTWVAQNEKELPSPTLVRGIAQNKGRGQRGNSWEAEPGKNFTGSVLFHPLNFPASSQFLLSEAIALAIICTLSSHGIEAKIKWPNDIYVGDSKICGILTEHVVTGRNITRTISGIGLNVNQEKFLSDAPNPTSMKIITGAYYNLDEISVQIADNIEKNLPEICRPDELHEKFMTTLWRNDGKFHPFFDKIKNEPINARIQSVASDGLLTIITDKGEKRDFAFKEIEFIL